MKIEEAFDLLINTRRSGNLIGVDRRRISNIKDRIKKGKPVTIETMRKFLLAAGWSVVPESWTPPT